MRSNWKIENLGKYISQQSTRNRGLEKIEVYSVTNSSGFTKSNEYFSKEVFSKNLANYKLVTRNQFAYNPSRINVGSIAYLSDTDFALVSPLYIIFEVDKDHLFPDYLLRYLKSHYGNVQIRNNTEGSVRDSLKYNGLEKIKIPIPPLNDQIRIANVLTRAEALIAKRKESINELDELVKSTFLEMFGDPVMMLQQPKTKLNEFIIFLTSGSRGWAQYYSKIGAVFLRINNVRNACFKLDDIKYVSPPNNAEAIRTKVKTSDLLLSITADLGRTAVINENLNGAFISQHLALIRLNQERINPVFVAWYFVMPYGKSVVMKKNRVGVKAGLNFDDIRGFDIVTPPLSLQNQFAAIIEKVEVLKTKYNRSLAELETLYSSLSERAFKGEMDMSKVLVETENEIIELQEEEKGISSVDSELTESKIYSEVELIKTIQSLEGETFSFDSLMTALEEASFEEMPEYGELKEQIYKMLEGTNPLLSQTFDKVKKEMVLRVNL